MAVGAALATAFVRIRPDTTGFGPELRGQVDREGAQAGSRFGKAFSDGASRNIKIKDTVQREIAKISDALDRARTSEANATGAVRVAEARLDDIRKKGKASATAILAAEESLARARRTESLAVADAKRLTDSLAAARANAAAREQELTDKLRKNTDATSKGLSALITAAVALGPALVPVLATAGAAAGGLGVALVSGGAALGVFGAVAKSSFKDIQDNLKLAKKGTEDLRSPIGRATNAYEGLTGAWDKFVAHNQPHVFRIFGAGFSILTQAIPKLQPLMDVAALAVARLEGQLGHFVSGGGLDRLVRFLTTNARPALEAFRQTFTNLGSGFGALAPLFARFAGSVEVGLVGLSARFAAWAKNSGPGGGFQRFIDYVVANGPAVASTLHELASAAVNIASGLGPLGPVSLSFVGAMARLIAVLPPGAITGIAAGFVAVQAALKLSAGASGLLSTSLFKNLGDIKAVGAASKLLNFASSGVGIGLASLALTGLIGVFVHHAQVVAESRARTEEFRTTLDKTTGAITLDTRAMAAHNLQASGALDAALKLGIGLSTITDAAVGNQAAIGQVNTAVSTARANYDQFVGTGQAMDKSLGDQQTAAGILSKAIGTTSGQVATARTRQQQLAAATQPTTVAIVSQAQAAQNAKRQLEQLSLSLLKVAGVNLNAAQTELQFRGSLDSLSQSVKNNGRSLSENTVKGRANRAAVLDSISAALQHANAVGEQTHSQTRAQQAFQNSIPAIREQARRLGLNKQQVDALVHSIGGLKPKTVDVGVVVKGNSVVLSGSRASVSTGSGTRAIRQTGFADGGVSGPTSRAFANGAEHHVAQIARPGDWRVWAEPETGGEAYIPLAASKRPRSTSILSSVAHSFGFGLIPAASGTILNGPGRSVASITGALQATVNNVSTAVARATVQALINAGRITPAITSSPGAGGNVTRWAGVILSVLRALGQSAANLGAVERRIAFESGGNPNAINLTDSNARAGHPSQGLTQTIPGTFAAFAGPYRGRGITDPFANIYAGMNYALHRYGSIAAIDPLVRPRGYDQGGVFLPGMVGMNVNGGRERVLNSRETAAYEGGSGIDYKLLAAAVVAALDRSVLPVSIGREVHRNFAKGARA